MGADYAQSLRHDLGQGCIGVLLCCLIRCQLLWRALQDELDIRVVDRDLVQDSLVRPEVWVVEDAVLVLRRDRFRALASMTDSDACG